MHKLLFVLSVVFLSGCWGAEFEGRTDFDEPVDSTVTETGTTTSTTGAGGSTSTSTSTTGGAGDSGSDSVTAGAQVTTTGSPTGTGACAPPTSIPELGGAHAWESYEAVHSRLCGQVATGTVRCAGEPCAEFTLPARVEPAGGPTLQITYTATDDQAFQVVHDCGTEAYTCDYVLQHRADTVYVLELRETAGGFVVEAFYELGEDPSAVDMMPTADFAARPVPAECAGMANPNVLSTDIWQKYVEWVRTLEWNCAGELI